MADSDLVFGRPPAANGNLVFGETGSGPTPEDVDIDVAAVLPGPTLQARVGLAYYATVAATLSPPTFSAEAQYRSNTDRPLTAATGASWREGILAESGVDNTFRMVASRKSNGVESQWRRAEHRSAETAAEHRNAARDVRTTTAAPWRSAARLHAAPMTGPWRNGDRSRRQNIDASWRDGQHMRAGTDLPWRNGDRSKRLAIEGMHRVAQAMPKGYDVRYGGRAKPLHRGWEVDWRNAIKPPAGTSTGPLPPQPPHVCYLPSGHIVFDTPWTSDAKHMVFSCEEIIIPPIATRIVPIRSVYIVINNTSLIRVVGNVALPAYSLSLTIDVDSWTWGFSASLPASCWADVKPDGGPVELEASINGSAYRLLAERVSRDRTFGQESIRVSGRGKSALLSSKYAPILTFANSELRSAQQLMEDVLTFNGVPIGWGIDWQLEDWNVPAGVFSERGAYIDALNKIAAAAGAYIQPHATNQELSVLLRYPSYPWDWAGVTPDFELPSAVTVQESIESLQLPVYNRVYVSGTRDGVLGRVTREGSAGDLLAPMVTDALITHAIAARQRGGSVLANTGEQEMVGLRLPVLPETGIITPGKFVRYTDGSDIRIGIVRSTSVEATHPDVWQSITVETHV